MRMGSGFGVDYEHGLKYAGTTYTGLSGKTKDDFGFGEHSFITNIPVLIIYMPNLGFVNRKSTGFLK